MSLTYDELSTYVDGHAGIRARTPLEPLGGSESKVFPPTYGVDTGATSKYALETRTTRSADGTEATVVTSVVLNSVAAQARRFGQVLREAFEDGDLELPVIGTDFTTQDNLSEYGQITDLDAPHRVYDAILRDSLDGDLPFRSGEIGQRVTEASTRNATGLFVHSPSSLIFGAWDSTGPKGGRGNKFERALTSEIMASDISVGVKTSSRIDPLGIEIKGSVIYEAAGGSWTLDENDAVLNKGKPIPLKPSEINHGNVRPSIDAMAGGVTATSIEAITVLSLIQLRRLKFVTAADGTPFDADKRKPVAQAARTTLAALSLCAVALAFEAGFDLRSRCVLAPTSDLSFDAIGRTGTVDTFTLTGAESLELVKQAAARASEVGIEWSPGLHLLTPTPRLAELVRRSRALSLAAGPDSAGE
jgi:CRISPR-associated protein Csb1